METILLGLPSGHGRVLLTGTALKGIAWWQCLSRERILVRCKRACMQPRISREHALAAGGKEAKHPRLEEFYAQSAASEYQAQKNVASGECVEG